MEFWGITYIAAYFETAGNLDILEGLYSVVCLKFLTDSIVFYFSARTKICWVI